jgi:hypothetical protein
MEASCPCDLDLEPITVHRTKIRKARKGHKCDECGADIKRGDHYHVHTGRCDGSWFTVKNCKECEQIREDYGCRCIGDLDTMVHECLGVHINRLPED